YSNAEDTTLEEPTKEGYTFDGWYENAEFSGDPVAVIKKESKGNRKFYAKWSAEEYEITYVLNGGTNDKNNPESYTIESEDIKLKNPSRAGYAFMGWYIDEKMTEKAGDIAIPSGSTGERTFYAGWSSNCYTVTLDPNGGAGGIESVLAAFDWNMPSATMPNREGYTFAGYFDAKSGGTKYYNADGSSAKVWDAAEDKTLYAQWTANDYKVAFDANGGTGSMPDQDMTYDKAAGLTQNTFTRDGYTFEGWNTQADGKGTAYADKESVKNLAAEKGGKVTLYAQWKKYEPVQNLKAVPAGKTVEKLTWTKVKGAEGYDVYFAKCGRKLKKIKSTKALTLKKAGLKKGSSYRYKVKAYRKADGKKVYISSAYVSHAIAGGYNKKYTDAKSIRALKKSITLEAGKTSTVKAAQTKFRKGRRFLKNSHVQLFRYASTDKTVAAVDRHGKVTAKKAGTCRIYIYAQNGLADFTTITVK
ncbi:MAG: InlB B-repeat-containing protein, partial [Anaerovoracaceae bacterium]